ncbi:hypothetical protein VTK26DRAFT_6229 [Humicola hyalothermophila]
MDQGWHHDFLVQPPAILSACLREAGLTKLSFRAPGAARPAFSTYCRYQYLDDARNCHHYSQINLSYGYGTL